MEPLEFYKVIANASPPGELYWKQSRELYFAGKTPMIIWSPFIMDELANSSIINGDQIIIGVFPAKYNSLDCFQYNSPGGLAFAITL